MKLKSLTTLILVSSLTLTLTASPAFAGGRKNDCLKGIVIGVGVAILVNAALNSSRDHSARGSCTVAVTAPPVHRIPQRGRWETRKEWTPPGHKKVWIPGHHNRKGAWVKGAWVRIADKPGYQKKNKARVALNMPVHGRRH